MRERPFWIYFVQYEDLLPKLNLDERLIAQIKNFTEVNNITISEDIIKKNFLNVQIYFETMTSTRVSQVPAVTSSEFLSEIGKSSLPFIHTWR